MQNPPVDKFLGRGSLLVAFDTGLGKTPIGIACAEELLGCGDIDMCVIVCEGSDLKFQWAVKLAEFTDTPTRVLQIRLNGTRVPITVPAESHCMIIDGTPAKREKQYVQALATRPDYVILSYDNIARDPQARKLKPGLGILDEATAIKTFKAERTKLTKRNFTPEYRLGLTATPIDNRPQELFSIMEWVDPTVLGRWDLFDKTFVRRDPKTGFVRGHKNLPVLRERLAPAMSRLTHEDPQAAQHLPTPHTRTVPVDVSAEPWWSTYLTMAGDLLDVLGGKRPRGKFDLAAYYSGSDSEDMTATGRIMSRFQAMERYMAHPDLLVISGQDYEESRRRRSEGEERNFWPGSKYAYQIWQEGLVDDVLSSPKLDFLESLVDELLSRPGKVLVYTQFRPMLDLIQERLQTGMNVAGITCVQFHGGMSSRPKTAAKTEFMTNPRCRIFLSSHAGARGTDLYAANHLINYDFPWASGKADQINGRHLRVASTFSDIYVHNLAGTGTLDMWKLGMLDHKRRIGSAILDGYGADSRGRVDNDLITLSAYLTGIVNGS